LEAASRPARCSVPRRSKSSTKLLPSPLCLPTSHDVRADDTSAPKVHSVPLSPGDEILTSTSRSRRDRFGQSTRHCSPASVGQKIVHRVADCVGECVVSCVANCSAHCMSHCTPHRMRQSSPNGSRNRARHRSRHRSVQSSRQCTGHCRLQCTPDSTGKGYRVGSLRIIPPMAGLWPKSGPPLHIDDRKVPSFSLSSPRRGSG